MKKHRTKKTVLSVLLVSGILLVAAVLLFFALRADRLVDSVQVEHGGEQLTRQPVTSIEHNGEWYKLRKDVQTVLLIGTDSLQEAETDPDLELFYNYDQADFLALVIFDDAKQTCTFIQINRDTMCSVPWLTVNGMLGGEDIEQIALAHTYGTGGEDSCENTCHAVENLLFGLPVTSYACVTMDAVPIMNDMVGGVTITLEEDLTDLDPSYTEGSRITLQGDAALSFVRARMSVGDGLNLSRMGRQRQYIAAFIDQFRASAGKDDALLVRIVEKLDKKLVLNLGMNQIRALSEKIRDYEILPPVVPKGENREGEMFMEYYVDEEALWETVREIFCTE